MKKDISNKNFEKALNVYKDLIKSYIKLTVLLGELSGIRSKQQKYSEDSHSSSQNPNLKKKKATHEPVHSMKSSKTKQKNKPNKKNNNHNHHPSPH